MRSERAALVVSALGALGLGLVAIAAAVATGSGAILLDGLFNLCFSVTALFTLRVAALLARPDDERYPFGYLFFEPLINTVKGLLILGVSLFAFVDAGIALATGGRDVAFGPALVYAAAATAVCAVLALLLARSSRRSPSPLVAADVANWTLNAAMSAGVFLGFLLAAWLRRRGLDGSARLVDPAMVALVVLASMVVPVRMAGKGLLALLNRAPAGPVVAGMEALARGALGGLPLRRLYVRAIQPGRTAYVVVHVVLPEGAGLDLAEADRLRGAVIDALATRHAPVVADVVFTGVEAFAAPTTGYAPSPS